MGFLNHQDIQVARDSQGASIADARRYVFAADGDTLAALFSDSELTSSTANPAVADASGIFPPCYVVSGTYQVVLRTPKGALISQSEQVFVAPGKSPLDFDTVGDLKSDLVLTYGQEAGRVHVNAGQLARLSNGHGSFQVADISASDADVTTAGGVGFYAVLGQDGFVTPEQFGAVGDGVTDDTEAMLMMTDFGRRTGFLNWRGLPGRTYTTTRSRIFACIPYQRHYYNGAAIRNIRGTSEPDVGLVSNYTGIEFPSIFDSQGPEDLTGGYYFGETIASVAQGGLDVTVLGSMTDTGLVAGADVLIYGFSSTGFGFPPDPRVYEYARIRSVSGSVITLEQPLQNDYDENWPEASNGNFGKPRIVSAQRPNHTSIQHLEVQDMWVRSNPNWTTTFATENDGERNGRMTLSGYIQAEFSNLRTDGGFYLSQGRGFVGKGISTRTFCEPDKVIDRAELTDFKGTRLQGGSIIKELILNNPQCGETFNLSPHGRLEINGGRISADSLTFHMLDIPSGVSGVVLNGVEWNAASSTQRGIAGGKQFSASFTVVDETHLSIPTDVFYSSSCSRVASDSMTLYREGLLAFQATKMPYESGSDIIIEGFSILDLSGTETLSVFTLRDLTINEPKIVGPYAAKIRGWHNPDYNNGHAVARVVSPWENDGFYELNDGFLGETDGYIFAHVGRPMQVQRIVVNVQRPYTGPAANPILRVRNYSDASATYATVDLAEPGQRVIDLAGGHFLKPGDTATLGSEPMGILRVDRTGQDQGTQAQQSKWSVRIEGARTS